MKVLISTGHGIINLVETAVALKKKDIDVKIITGWVPNKFVSDKLVDILGLLLKRKGLSSGINRRKDKRLDSIPIYTCSFAEFFIQFLFILNRFNLISRARAAFIGWKLFGYQSKKYLKNADIFHVRSGAGQAGAIRIAKKRGLKVVVDHSIAHPAELQKQLIKANNNIANKELLIEDNIFWKLVLEDCKMADSIIVNSEYVKETFVENGFNEEQLYVVYMGISEIFFRLKKNWEIEEEYKILFIGGFGQRKGANLIIDMAKELIAKGENFELNIVGDIMRDITVPKWFRNSNRIKLHGSVPLESLVDFLQSNDIFIFPSYVEGSAQSLKIAMASGIPVIATKQSGGPLKHLSNGYVIPDNSSKALTEAVVTLANDKKMREYLGKNGVMTITKEHTWDIYAERVIEIYSELLK